MPDVFSDPPVLRTERLVLRQITESDGEGLFGIFADDQVTEFYAWDRFTDVGQGHELAARTAGKFRQREAIRWGLVLARDYWRRGLMSEAVAAVLRFGFEQMALHRVEATVLTGNTASAALLGRAGFQREGVLRGRFLKREAFWDVWMFGLTRADWAAPGIQDRQPYRTAGPSTRQPSTRAGLGRLRSWLDRGGVRLSCR